MNQEHGGNPGKIEWIIGEIDPGHPSLCGIERVEARKSPSQFSNIFLLFRPFLVFEGARLTKGTIWDELKISVCRAIVAQFVKNSSFFFNPLKLFIGGLSLEQKWRLVIESQVFSFAQFTTEFFRFITPALSSGSTAPTIEDLASGGVPLAKPRVGKKKKKKKS